MIFTSLPSRIRVVDPFARGADDRGGEAAGQATIGRGDDDQVTIIATRAGQQGLGAPSPDTPAARLAITAAMRWA
jgi:hypothetical protein